MFDRARNFVGYRGFGVCRDLEGLARLDALRRTEFFSDPAPLPLSADWPQPPHAAAFTGLAGEIVSVIEPHSESDPVAILAQLLVLHDRPSCALVASTRVRSFIAYRVTTLQTRLQRSEQEKAQLSGSTYR